MSHPPGARPVGLAGPWRPGCLLVASVGLCPEPGLLPTTGSAATARQGDFLVGSKQAAAVWGLRSVYRCHAGPFMCYFCSSN